MRFIKSLYLQNTFFYGLLVLATLFVLSFFMPIFYIPVGILFWLFLLACMWDIVFLYAGKGHVAIVRQYPERLSNGDNNELSIQVKSHYPQAVKLRLLEEFPIQLQVRDLGENIFQRALSRISKWLSNLIPSTSLFNASETFYKVLAAVAMLVFLFILYKVLFTGKRLLGPSDEEGERADPLRFIEKNLLDVDLEHFIEKAKQSADYALAIRYLNLLNIQLLAQKGHILWKPSKTNQELLGEIKDPALRSEFEQNVAIFNRAWFSGMHVDATQYAVYAARFLHFQSKWK